MLGVGDSAPDFQLEDTFGKQRSLRDYLTTKPALLAFFKSSCPVCQLTFPFLERLSKSDNMEVIAISQDGLDTTERFRSDFEITFTTLLDQAERGYPVSNAFDVGYVPSLFLVEPDGQISLSVSGFSKKDLEAVGRLAGVEPFRPGERVPDFKAG
jgi:methylamine dehydrogenase accessory protein MauD